MTALGFILANLYFADSRSAPQRHDTTPNCRSFKERKGLPLRTSLSCTALSIVGPKDSAGRAAQSKSDRAASRISSTLEVVVPSGRR